MLTRADAAALLAVPPPKRRAITLADQRALQERLRVMLRCPSLALDDPATRGGTVTLRVGGETLGTVDEIVDEGERSWVITLSILEADLAIGPERIK